MKNFIKSADRMCAALLGFSGRQMLSTELIYQKRMLWMKNILDEIEPQHCENSAIDEGAYSRLKDRSTGHR